MRAIRVEGEAQEGADGLQRLRLAEVDPPPPPGPGEALIDVTAGALNFADLLMLTGAYQETPAAPFTAGMELSGTVAAVGKDVDGVFVGDRVAAYAGSGAFAERALVKDHACLQVPPGADLATAAALPVAFGTAHVGLVDRARLRMGELLLVTGAGGGVGLAAVALGAALGAEVIAAASSAEKLALAEAHGAAHRIDYATEDLRARVKEIAAAHGKSGADVVFDPVGGALFQQALRATGFEGRVLAVGFASGEVPQIPANLLLVKNIDVIGFYWGGYATRDPDVHRQSFRALYEMLESGRIRPEVARRLPLERAEEGYRLMRERKLAGRVIFDVAGA